MLQNPNIFYTDDDEDDQELFRGALNEVDDSLVLTTAGDGDALLSLLESTPPVPRLIFLDLNMPRRDGYEVLHLMRASESMKNYPVIVFSTTSDTAAVEKTRAMGANLFVPKPRTYDALKKAIQTCININWQGFRPEGQPYMLRFS